MKCLKCNYCNFENCICFNETAHDKWCLDKSVEQTENDFERGFVKNWLNSA